MRGRAVVLIALSCSAMMAQTARVPFVGCKSFGQADIRKAPEAGNQVVRITATEAAKLAYYKASVAPGVLAPKGWNCVGLYGSSGGDLLVAPQSLDGDVFVRKGQITGPSLEVSEIGGGTSGRDEVAQVIARVFPGHKAFVQDVIDSFDFTAGQFTFAPYPGDKLTLQTDKLVEYQTAAGSEGLGSVDTRLSRNGSPIEGVAILEGDTPDLLMLRVRLPRELRDLTPAIIHQFEREHNR